MIGLLLSPLALRLGGAALIAVVIGGAYLGWRAEIRSAERAKIELEARREQERRMRNAEDAGRAVPHGGPELDEWLRRRLEGARR
jgi:hypothetical protein